MAVEPLHIERNERVKDYSEDTLIEQPAIALFGQLGWQTLNCYDEKLGTGGTLGRDTRAEVVLVSRLRPALERLNPTAPREAIDQAIEALTRDRSALSPASANRELYRLLKDGVNVTVRDEQTGDETAQTIRVLDWNAPARNDFLLCSQLWIAGEMYTRRADLVGFVNGLPLVFVELKATHRRLKAAYDGNLRDYKSTIPQLFWYNALIILSNGGDTRLGSITSGWEHFFEWKKIDDEGEAGVVSLETTIRGVCGRSRLLDLVENFTLFDAATGALTKKIAKNHQYLGVNQAVEAVRAIRQNQGRLGVFWHTQGSGKSLSMVCFTQKVLRKLTGNWTFLLVTDRDELDDQIYKTFANTGAVTEPAHEIQAQSGAHLQELLRADHRVIFTLIQKFHTEPGQPYPKLSDRADVIVITDEAHRSQYDTLALNMRAALPRAAFIAFTGTPLIVGEEKTREVFGDYISVYNFRQSVEDGTTVPLYYENRVPELQLTNTNFNDDMQRILESAILDDEQERLLERQFAHEYHLITRDDRLERIAEDLVAHFMARGQTGKAMVVSVDKATAVRMYDKVQLHWRRYLDALRERVNHATGDEREQLATRLRYMQATDMAVVVSQGQNEIEDFRAKGLDIQPHRRRMLREDLEKRFKDADDPLRIVFVCAMWMTGFDVPSLTTIYLDKPMRNHTLMQTIARANRVFGDKVNGLIVDYIGIFRDLQKALAIYGTGGSGASADEPPIKDKAALLAELQAALDEAGAYCSLHDVDLRAIIAARGLDRVRLLDDATDALVVNDEIKREYLRHASAVARLYRAILPDASAAGHLPLVTLLAVIARKIKALGPEADISELMADIDKLLEESISTEGYVIHGIQEEDAPSQTDRRVDLSQIDFDGLRAHFESARKHIEAQKLRGQVQSKATQMARLNRTRMDYLARLQQLLDDYNSGSINVAIFFDKLVALAKELNAEDQRAISEQLTEEELAIFDLLTRPDPPLTDKEREQVKQVARTLLQTLKREKLMLDWRKKLQTRADVLLTVQKMLDASLPRAYTPQLYDDKCDRVYQHIYESYADATHNIYARAS
jgi:type I restriction enzyme R subunit